MLNPKEQIQFTNEEVAFIEKHFHTLNILSTINDLKKLAVLAQKSVHPDVIVSEYSKDEKEYFSRFCNAITEDLQSYLDPILQIVDPFNKNSIPLDFTKMEFPRPFPFDSPRIIPDPEYPLLKYKYFTSPETNEKRVFLYSDDLTSYHYIFCNE